MTNKYEVYWFNELDDFILQDEKDLISVHETYDDAFNSIKDWWSKNNFNPKILRFIGDINEDGYTTIDYGSHFNFYQIVKKEVHE